jgi:hypothetical protein
MYPDAFCTELSDSLTAFYEKILKKVGTRGCAVGKALPSKLEAEKIPVLVPMPSTEDAKEGHDEEKDPPLPLPAAAQATVTADGAAAPGCATADAPPESGARRQRKKVPECWRGLCLI